jgi:hypothetical protein
MQVELRTGHPVEVLVRLGQTADLLIVGARGRGGFRQLLTGSVATQRVNHAVPSHRGAKRASRRTPLETQDTRRRAAPVSDAGMASFVIVKGQLDFPVGGQLISLLADRLSPCPRSADLLLI